MLENLHRELFWCMWLREELRRGTREICSLRIKVKVTKTNNAKTICSHLLLITCKKYFQIIRLF